MSKRLYVALLVAIVLLIPAMQVVVVRFINPPLTLPMLIDQGGAMFSRAPRPPLLYHWIDLPQIPEMFLEHLWISEDQRFFQHRVKGFASRGCRGRTRANVLRVHLAA